MKLARSNAIISILSDEDLTGKEGHFVRMSSNTAIALIDHEMSPPFGLLLTAGNVHERVTVAISAGGLAGNVSNLTDEDAVMPLRYNGDKSGYARVLLFEPRKFWLTAGLMF